MNPERWQRLKELFGQVQELAGAERERFLERTCADDSELLAELEALLAAGRDAERFLEEPPAGVVMGELSDSGASVVGRRFGPYRAVAELGRGGMGVVCRAVRDDDTFHKEVALKLLHTDLESAFVVERFRRERQILASLEHPNIARLLDGGADEAGRPYCVLELVEGERIDEYCRRRELDLTARLELVRIACSAVALAHSRLVVHCDLKPANVLVTPDGTLKLLDFGIARLVSPETGGPASAATATGWWMTPEYASPEQVRGEPLTTATDVYALGVMLYELLTGRKPYRLGTRGPREVMRAICEDEVTRPSQAVLRAAAGADCSASASSSSGLPASAAGPPDPNPRRLRRRLEGDLDTIVLRALAKDPDRRYRSVVQLSDDLRRYLTGMPIRARPDRLGYRAGKFVQRHRTAVAATLLGFAGLCAGLVATVQQARIASAERAAAQRRFEEVRGLARTFIFEVHDLVAALPGSTSVRKRIVEVGLEYLERLEAEAGDDLFLRAELAAAYERIAAVQGGVGESNLGDADGAIRSQRRALALRETVVRFAPGDLPARLALARAHSTLGGLLGSVGDREGRRREIEAARTIRVEASAIAPDDPALRRALASSLWDAAQLRVDDGDPAGAFPGFQEALEIYRDLADQPEASDVDRRNLALAAKKVGAVRSALGDPEGALADLGAALEIDLRRLTASPSHPETRLDVSFDHSDLGYVLLQLGRVGEAVAHYERAVALREAVAAADPEDVRAQSVLRIGRLRLAGALAAELEQGGLPCSKVRRSAARALELWSAVEADRALEHDVSAQRERVRAIVAGCGPA